MHLWEASCHVFVICLNASFLIHPLSYASYFYIYMRFVLCSLMRSLVAPVHLTKPLFPLHGLRAQRKTQERTGTVRSSLVTRCKHHKYDVFHSHHFCLLVLPIIVIVISLYCLPVPLVGLVFKSVAKKPFLEREA